MKSNIVILPDVMAVNSGKHSDRDNEPDYVICTLLDLLSNCNVHCTPRNYRAKSTDALSRGFYCGYFPRDFRSVSSLNW